jgi:DNA-binding response OmpR family regulator
VKLDILVVDDDELVRTTTHFALSDAGHSVTQAADGARALAMIRSCPFDVAIFDVRLPKIDGMTLFRMIRRQAPATAVIMMTSHVDVRHALECLQEGPADYLTKPLDTYALLRRIEGIAARVALRKQGGEVRGVTDDAPSR